MKTPEELFKEVYGISVEHSWTAYNGHDMVKFAGIVASNNKSTLEKIQEIASDEPSPWLKEARERQNIAENEPSLWLAEARERQMYLNMQYYYEYVVANGYVTPQDWLENHKHF